MMQRIIIQLFRHGEVFVVPTVLMTREPMEETVGMITILDNGATSFMQPQFLLIMNLDGGENGTIEFCTLSVMLLNLREQAKNIRS